jgi:microcystin-dependent protein
MTIFAGTILPYGGSSAPSGFLLCFGQAVSRSTYADLFAAIGTTFGAGDGSTTFNVPDLRGRIPAGQDDMGGTPANRLTDQPGGVDGSILGASGGDEVHTLTTAEMPSHTHTGTTASDGSHSHSVSGQNPLNSSTIGPVNVGYTGSSLSGTTDSAGSHTPLAAMIRTITFSQR